MAEYCRTIFGDMLLTEPLEKYPVRGSWGRRTLGEAFLENLVTPGAGRCHNRHNGHGSWFVGMGGRLSQRSSCLALCHLRGSGWPGCTEGTRCVLCTALVHLCLPALGNQEQRPHPASRLEIFPSRQGWAGQCHMLGITEGSPHLPGHSLHLTCTTDISVGPGTPLVPQLPCQETWF